MVQHIEIVLTATIIRRKEKIPFKVQWVNSNKPEFSRGTKNWLVSDIGNVTWDQKFFHTLTDKGARRYAKAMLRSAKAFVRKNPKKIFV